MDQLRFEGDGKFILLFNVSNLLAVCEHKIVIPANLGLSKDTKVSANFLEAYMKCNIICSTFVFIHLHFIHFT